MNTRIEKDTMGDMEVPVDAYWAAQTQRSIQNFAIGEETMPYEVTRGFSYLKKAVALKLKVFQLLVCHQLKQDDELSLKQTCFFLALIHP